MHIPTLASLRRINIRMRIHPHNRHLTAQPFANGARGAGDGADGDGVVAAEGEDEAALGGVGVDLGAEAVCDGGDGDGVFHVAVGGVGGGSEGGVGVDCVVVVEGVAEVFCELGEEAGGYEGCGGGVDAGFALGGGLVGCAWFESSGGMGLRWVEGLPGRLRSRLLPRRAHCPLSGTWGQW